MGKIIKEAETLWWKLCNAMLNIPYDFEPDHTIAITETADFLKKLSGRKDNIVDLAEVWHNVDEEPDGTRNILIDSSSYVCNTISPLLYDDGRWKHIVKKLNVMRWAYIEDLLPKGGEEWSITK